MDGIHDLGGMQGFGAISPAPTPDEPPFHEPWEGRIHGLRIASAIATGSRTLRPYIEAMGHAEYLTTSYYEHWLAAVEAQLVEDGVVDADELVRCRSVVSGGAVVPVRHDAGAAEFVRSLFRPFPVEDADGPPPAFAVGDGVRVRRIHPPGHTRCPRYVRGAAGTVVLVHPAHPLPDAGADGRVEPFYSVAFEPTELWGDDAEPGRASVRVDLWESYLEELG